jgi:cytochrome c5
MLNQGEATVSDQDRTFMATFVGVLGVLVVFAVVIYFVAQAIVGEKSESLAENPMLAKGIRENIKPVGQLTLADDAAPAANPTATGGQVRSGMAVYEASCLACHGAGVAGAPKVGDAAAWESRARQGMATLLEHATKGLNAMPAMGTCADCSDAELEAAISYMLDQAGVDVAGGGGSAKAVVVPEPDQASGLDLEQGKQIVQSSCFACHGTGAAGAPKIGDKAAWAPRIAQGRETLLTHSIQGLRAMPPRGACMTCSDDDLKAAIDYMISQIQ